GRAVYGAAPLIIAAAIAIPQGVIKPDPEAIFETESPYHYIQVVEKNGTRYLKLNEGWAVHSAYNPDRELTDSYWDYFLVGPWFGAGGTPERVLNIGSAAGTMAGQFARYYPDTAIDGVELDPDVVEAGRDFFAMDYPNLTVHVADGRPFLETSRESWDFIAIDAYRQPYIPFYLTTQEFFQAASNHLNEGGAVMINVAHTPGDEALVEAIGATMRSVFPSVWQIRAGSFNKLLVATREPSTPEAVYSRLSRMPAAVAALAEELEPRTSEVTADGEILTDDRAPVEWLTDQMIINYATGESG
ncbi:MAG: fused MFS/spermidine synthase, partial [Pseudomonadota bacterium]